MAKIAFVFPGQGSQYSGMGRDLVGFPPAMRIFQKAQDVLGIDVKAICTDGSEEELRQTKNTQTAIFVVNHICCELLAGSGIKADMLAGHSLGEYNALVAAGVFGFKQGLELIAKRAQLMQEAAEEQDGAMMAILGLSAETVSAVLESLQNRGLVAIANYNCPGQIVISGEKPVVEKAGSLLRDAGAKRALMLPVNGAFHTPMMNGAETKLMDYLQEVNLNDARVPVASNSTAGISTDRIGLKNALSKQMVSPVLWQQSIEQMKKRGVDVFIEAGPKKVLTGLIKRIDSSAQVLNVENAGSLASVRAVLVSG
jgi:[acyl-carrier-protein] S-malonyltransferase